MAPNKINVKERFSDGEIDLSMSDLTEVPVKEIAVLKKATCLDLSNNRLSALPKNFTTLVHITKLDLSKNELKELPEDFGSLNRLKYLDLYQNQLQHLPLSFSKLKDLRFLDVKDNPLVPTVAKVAGRCLDTKQCQNCARDVVNFFTKLQEQVDSEVEMRNKNRQKQLEINQNKKREEEKKNKKKEKQKPKQEPNTVTEQKNKPKSKKEIKKSNIKNSEVPKRGGGSFFRWFIFLGVIIISSLFVLTSVKFKYTTDLDRIVREFYSTSVQKLPPNFQRHGVHVGSLIGNVHEKTGNLTLNLMGNVHKYFNFRETLDNLYDIFLVLYKFAEIKFNEVYGSFVKSDVQ